MKNSARSVESYLSTFEPVVGYNLLWQRLARGRKRRDQDHFALRPQKRGCLLGTGTGGVGGVGGG